MPVQRAAKSSGLMGKLNPQVHQWHEQYAGEEVEYSSFGDLPPGMSGVAKLVDCKFDLVKEGKQNAGEYYFYAAGIVVSPKQFTDAQGQTHYVEGKRTSIMEMMCDTPKSKSRPTQEDHYKWVLNELKKLGADMTSVGPEQLEETAQALKEAQPYFAFRTWQGEASKEFPNPRVNHVWERQVDFDDSNDDPTGAVEDDTPMQQPARAPRPATPAITNNGTPAKGPANQRAQASHAKPVQLKPEPTKSVGVKPAAPANGKASKQPEPEFTEMDTAESLLTNANAGDEDAQQKLCDMAIAAGADDNEVSAAPDWDTVYELYQVANGGEVGEEATDEWGIEVGSLAQFTPKGAKAPVEVEIISISDDQSTCDLRNTANKKLVYKAVRIENLEPPATE